MIYRQCRGHYPPLPPITFSKPTSLAQDPFPVLLTSQGTNVLVREREVGRGWEFRVEESEGDGTRTEQQKRILPYDAMGMGL